MKIPIEISNRHVHLSRKDIDFLFGKNYNLTEKRKLSQPGEFAAEEKVSILHNGFEIKNVRVLGPERKETQIELLEKDLQVLGFQCPVRTSGDLADTPGIEIKGPKGKLKTKNGSIIANRHLHLTPEDAEKLKIENKIIKIKVSGRILDNIIVRINHNAALAVHINKDDEFAKYVGKETFGELFKDNFS